MKYSIFAVLTLLLLLGLGQAKEESKEGDKAKADKKPEKYVVAKPLDQEVKTAWPAAKDKALEYIMEIGYTGPAVKSSDSVFLDTSTLKGPLKQWQSVSDAVAKSLAPITKNHFAAYGICSEELQCKTITNTSHATLDKDVKATAEPAPITLDNVDKFLKHLIRMKEIKLTHTLQADLLYAGEVHHAGVAARFTDFRTRTMDAKHAAGMIFDLWKTTSLEQKPTAARAVLAQTDDRPVHLQAICIFSPNSNKAQADHFCRGQDKEETKEDKDVPKDSKTEETDVDKASEKETTKDSSNAGEENSDVKNDAEKPSKKEKENTDKKVQKEEDDTAKDGTPQEKLQHDADWTGKDGDDAEEADDDDEEGEDDEDLARRHFAMLDARENANTQYGGMQLRSAIEHFQELREQKRAAANARRAAEAHALEEDLLADAMLRRRAAPAAKEAPPLNAFGSYQGVRDASDRAAAPPNNVVTGGAPGADSAGPYTPDRGSGSFGGSSYSGFDVSSPDSGFAAQRRAIEAREARTAYLSHHAALKAKREAARAPVQQNYPRAAAAENHHRQARSEYRPYGYDW